MAEAGKSVVDALDGNILYISVMNRLSIDCDCDGNPSEPDMHDMGILASTDPVALKIVSGIKNFVIYIAFVMLFSFATGLVINLLA